MSPVVSNTTPISNLLRIGYLPLLEQLFGRILIPSQVAAELTRGQPILGTWQEAPGAQSITVIEVKTSPFLHQLESRLDAGEAAAIVSAEIIAMKESPARTPSRRAATPGARAVYYTKV